jgi:hypothetical protein
MTIFIAPSHMFGSAMQTVLHLLFRQAAFAVMVALCLWPAGAAALDLFARHQVSVEFATSEGKPLANAEVRVFAPGKPDRPVLTGHTDDKGKFEFPADEDGFWSAEARAGGEIARVMIRVGGSGQQAEPMSPVWLIGGLMVLLVLAVGFRILRARNRRPPP